jgi:Ni,Fe-hydrogenase I large subunit
MPRAGVEGISHILPAPGADTGFSRTPHWHGKPVETGSLARQASHPLLAAFVAQNGNTVSARLLAQLVELASWLAPNGTPAGVVQQYTGAKGIGLGLAETARGLLVHQAQVSEGHVEHYRIVAPTEWNFHPGGPLTQGLVGRPVKNTDDARRSAALLVQALDPCVACAIEVADA